MKLTQAEWHLMNALWKGHPATAREISERLALLKTLCHGGPATAR